MINKRSFYKILYGAIFIVLLPVFLYLWSTGLDKYINLPIPTLSEHYYFSLFTISISLLIGLIFLLGGWYALYKYGKGFPMNPFPPEKFVTRGVYSILPHPIYTGFCFLTLGIFLMLQSQGGVWIIFPVVCLGCVSLVYGYEKEAIENNFGKTYINYIFKLPEDSDIKTQPLDYIRVYILVLLPWFFMYEIVQYIGASRDAFSLMFAFEQKIPVIEWTELIYFSVYPMVLLFPLFIKTKSVLRKFSVYALIATGLCFIIYLTLPVTVEIRAFIPQSPFGALLNFERSLDKPVCAFPSFHVIWAFICASCYCIKTFSKRIVTIWAILVSISCLTTGMHSIADVIGALLLYYLIGRRWQIWNTIRSISEKIANSWSELYIGKVRFINHGLWAALGVFIGLAFAFLILTPMASGSIIIMALCGVTGAGLWAQLVEGSSGLLRPYGYYGGILGAIIGGLIASLFYGDFYLLISAFALAGPIIQSFGRCRCLVQGCCHGRPADKSVGIRYYQPNSRVTRMAKLGGVYIHPTPVYSILWNVIIFIILLRMYVLHSEPNLITGLYLILTGLGRFVEESLRGEPQTKIIGGLRLYNWIAIITIICGSILSAFPSGLSFPDPAIEFSNIYIPFILAIIVYFALGVDVPSSNRRFSRLT
jgi:protein-S-isoprenylcysteine O-methyltransferase Ste14